MTRGVLIFGINNERVDYGRLAMIAAAFVRKNMPGIPISLVTDTWTHDCYPDELKKSFNDIITIPAQEGIKNARVYRDTHYHTFKDQFKNESRSNAYNLSPYDETLLIDCDFLVCNDSLNNVWGNTEDVMINRRAKTLHHQPMDEEELRLNPFGSSMYWATVIYFKKSEKAKLLFDFVDFIKHNWEFYKLTYNFPGHLFRNDYAFSIAIHVLGGFQEGDFVVDLPGDGTILTATDFDQFYGITDPKTLHFFMNDRKDNWKFYATKTTGLNVHCMNKLSILNNREAIMEVLDGTANVS